MNDWLVKLIGGFSCLKDGCIYSKSEMNQNSYQISF